MIKYALTILIFISLPLRSAILPSPNKYDHRMTSVQYNPDNVINVRTGIGTVTLIQLEEGEEVIKRKKGLMLGDASAWGFDLVGNHIFLKPKVKNPNTNLILTTNKGRTYTFYLEVDDYPHYMVKINYPKIKKKNIDGKFTIPCMGNHVNFEYEKWGDLSLAPNYMWDNGTFTCLKFNNAVELPVIYQVLSDNSESMIPYHIEKNIMVVHGTSNQFRLRIGDSVLGLITNHLKVSGYNEKKSTINAKRVIKNGR